MLRPGATEPEEREIPKDPSHIQRLFRRLEREGPVQAIAAVAAVPVAPSAARAAEVTIFSDSPLQLALTNIAQDFQRASGHTVRFVFGLSPVIHKKVVNGEATDVVIIQPNFID